MTGAIAQSLYVQIYISYFNILNILHSKFENNFFYRFGKAFSLGGLEAVPTTKSLPSLGIKPEATLVRGS